MAKIHIIAEAGTNHNADATLGRRLIDVAQEAGADSVKFQIIYPEGLYVEKLKNESGDFQDNEVIEVRRKGMLSDGDYRSLSGYAHSQGVPLSASIFDQRGIELLEEFNPPYIKIASCDANNIPLIAAAARTGRKLIISTGMSTMSEVRNTVGAIEAMGHKDLVLMHCVSVYPCPTRQMNLQFLTSLREEFGYEIGLSDHTENSLAAAAAVALGVTWIEKHFTLDRTSQGFDHAYAMEPEMLTEYIQDVRAIEAAMLGSEDKVGEQEASVKVRARRGLYAARDIRPGEVIQEDDVLIVRPEAALAPGQLRIVVGQKSVGHIPQYEPLTLEHLDQAS